jgi:hypothetical protein
MVWQKVGSAAFTAFIVGALVTAQPEGLVRKSCGQGGVGGANGVIVDAQGVLHNVEKQDPTGGEVWRAARQAAKAQLGVKVTTASKLRKVSLNRLEAAIKDANAKNQPWTEEMKYLAGLTRVRYVFYLPESRDIVLAGPAEGWAADMAGRVRGIESGRATLELQDLVVALRSYPASGKKTRVILCSIDPTPEGLAAMQKFLSSIHPSPNDEQFIVDGLRTNLGYQNIRIEGVTPSTHFAQVLIEADYRMKLIGIGLEKPAVKMASYVDRATPRTGGSKALQRWYFVPDYQSVRVAADDLGMELVGNGVKLVSEDQIVSADGSRHVTGKADKASHDFVSGFTRKYAEIAQKVPVYAQLRNCIDLAVAAAFIQEHHYYDKAGWQMETFADEKAVPVETLNVPTQVESVVTSVWKGGTLMTPVGGGVTIHPLKALDSPNLLADEDGKVEEVRESLDLKGLAAGQWWWD